MSDNLPQTIREKTASYITCITNLAQPKDVQAFIDEMAFDTHKTCVINSFHTPSITTIGRNESTRKNYVICVKFMLVKLDRLLNVKGFVPEQIDEIPMLLLAPEFAELRLNDINLICRFIATARYPKAGHTYNKMDVQTFFQCVREYMGDDERISAREFHHRQSHLNKHESVKEFSKMDEEIKDLFIKPKDKITPLRLDEVPPIQFKTTDKQYMKKLKGERND